MKTTQGAAPNHIMSTTQVPRPRNEPKTFGVTFSYFTTLPLRPLLISEFASLCKLQHCNQVLSNLLTW